MKPNIVKLKELVNSEFNGNKAAFANAIGVDRSHVSKVLKDGSCAGAHFFGGLMSYCENKKLNYKDYIFFITEREKN